MTKRQPFPSRTATVVARTTAAAVQGERRAARFGNHAPGPPARVTRRGRWRVGGREVGRLASLYQQKHFREVYTDK